ncbi:hypothetical protein [Thiorhodovibrio litoralis]|uniref:hypothetical protein n=1 Tax=Thiorhodovibrio litoralis TaxID=2952932 RepID=UPI002B2590F5|nr:hypothetical protein [Thiorhodovibrio litoralis]WPL12188.1 hypothetical protein Thiosp_01948 [Thiorhodovibrio litoralis]
MLKWNPRGLTPCHPLEHPALRDYSDPCPILVCAALWCDLPVHEVRLVVDSATEVEPGIYQHPEHPSLESKCRTLHAAIDADELPVYRLWGMVHNCWAERNDPENISRLGRHLMLADLKAWIDKHHPNEPLPSWLFDSESEARSQEPSSEDDDWFDNPEVPIAEQRKRAILTGIEALRFNRLAIPYAGKSKVKDWLRETEYKKLFEGRTTFDESSIFEEAWKKGLKTKPALWKTENHEKHSRHNK